MSDRDFIVSVLRVLDRFDVIDDVWLIFDGRFDRTERPGALDFYVNCNDLFAWGTADQEKVTPENLPVLAQALEDVGPDHHKRGLDLFACRVRGQRPQKPVMRDIPAPLIRFFDECGS